MNFHPQYEQEQSTVTEHFSAYVNPALSYAACICSIKSYSDIKKQVEYSLNSLKKTLKIIGYITLFRGTLISCLNT